MSKFFNTAGPIIQDDHYFVPISQRMDLDEVMSLIDMEKYFVIHAPRQTGKTTAMLEVVRLLNASGQYRALYYELPQNFPKALSFVACGISGITASTRAPRRLL